MSGFGLGSGLILSGSGYSPSGFGFSGTRLHHYMKAEFNIVQSKFDKLVQGQTRIEAGVKLLTAVNHVNLNAIRKLYKDDLPKLKSSIKNDLKSGGITLQTQRKVENFVENIKNDRIETRYYYIYQTIT